MIGKRGDGKDDKFSFTRMELKVPASMYVPYEGHDAEMRRRFPKGFPIAPGSSLTFKGRRSDGALEFLAITDRGPNGDSPDYDDDANPATKPRKTKVFPAPNFAPKIALIRVKKGEARLVSLTDIKTADGTPISGRPLKAGIGSTHEVALDEVLAPVPFDANGMDPEGIALDRDGRHVWTCDEYGPFLTKIELASGRIVAKLAPGSGLPSLLRHRQPNRGCEGLASTPGGKVVMAMQSTLDLPDVTQADGSKRSTAKAAFIRLVEVDPASGQSRMWAYPHDRPAYGKSRDAKIGAIVALSDTRFALIEQGPYKSDDEVHNVVYVIDTQDASDLSGKSLPGGLELEYANDWDELAAQGLQPVKKVRVLDLKEHGWTAEKAEGLAMVDARTLAVINDNDFGLKARLRDADGQAHKPDDCVVNAAGEFSGSKCKAGKGEGPLKYELEPAGKEERATSLWLVKLPRKLADYRP